VTYVTTQADSLNTKLVKYQLGSSITFLSIHSDVHTTCNGVAADKPLGGGGQRQPGIQDAHHTEWLGLR